MLKGILEKVEVQEAKVKWSFNKKNNALSYAPTIETEVDGDGFYELYIAIGHDGDAYFGYATAEDDQGEYMDFSKELGSTWMEMGGSYQTDSDLGLPNIIKSVEKAFKTKVDQKMIKELVTYVGMQQAGLV